jgi:hypothetical protein
MVEVIRRAIPAFEAAGIARAARALFLKGLRAPTLEEMAAVLSDLEALERQASHSSIDEIA